jgi:hypothetical protein
LAFFFSYKLGYHWGFFILMVGMRCTFIIGFRCSFLSFLRFLVLGYRRGEGGVKWTLDWNLAFCFKDTILVEGEGGGWGIEWAPRDT